MADAVVGALRVTLGADTAEFESALEGAAAQFEKWGKNLGGIAGVAAAAFAAAVGIIGTSLAKTINQIEELGKVAEKVGIPVEELSALEHAANLADVSTESLSGSMVKLAKNMSAVAGGTEGPASKAFEALNVQVTKSDGTLRDTSDIITELSKKFSGFQDSAEKTALAVAIFGKSGAEMIPFLNQGAEGLAKATEEAQRFGLVLSTETVEAARQFNDDFKRLGAIQEGIWRQVAAEALPTLTKFSAALVELASNTQFSETVMIGIQAVIKEIAAFVIQASAAFEELVRTITLVSEVFKAAKNFSLDEIKAAWDRYTVATAAADAVTKQALATLFEEQTELDTLIVAWEGVARAQDNANKGRAPIIAATTAHKNALDQFIASTEKNITALNAEIATFGQNAGAREALRIVMQAEDIARQNNITLTDAQREAIKKLAEEMGRLRDRIEGLRLIEESLPAWERYEKAVERAREQFIKAKGDLEGFDAVNEKIAERFGFTWEQQSASFVKSTGGMITAIGTLSNEQQKAAKLAQIAGAASALISSYQAAAQTLTQVPFPFNLAAAASVLAAGLAFVASLKGVAFAKGGSFTVGGGLTGVDSELVAFRATPGEMVDVRRPGQTGGGAPTQINLTMTPRADQFFASHVREMVYALNKAAPDGYILKMSPA